MSKNKERASVSGVLDSGLSHSENKPAPRKRGQLFVVGHEKGGVGKSALAANLSVACSMQGMDVVLIDTDRSGANASWGKIRDQASDELSKVTVIEATTNPLATIRDLIDRYDVIVVDLAAGDYSNLPELALLTDLLIVPTGVGREVLQSTVKVYNTMRHMDSRHKNGHIPMVCIFNCVRQIPKEEQAARDELASACPDLPISSTTIYDRKVFRDASWSGRSILEMPKRDSEKAAQEFTDAMRSVFRYVSKSNIDAAKNSSPSDSNAKRTENSFIESTLGA